MRTWSVREAAIPAETISCVFWSFFFFWKRESELTRVCFSLLRPPPPPSSLSSPNSDFLSLPSYLELVHVVRDPASSPSQSERRPDDQRELPDHCVDRERLLHRGGRARGGSVEADVLHSVLEELAVLGLVDRGELGADELDAVPGEKGENFFFVFFFLKEKESEKPKIVRGRRRRVVVQKRKGKRGE